MAIRRGDLTPSKVYRGDLAVSRIYRGDVRVWPAPTVNVEDFTTARTGGWDNFTPGSLGQARQVSGQAALVTVGSGASALAYGQYSKPVGADDQYLEVRCAAPVTGVLDTGASGAATYVRLRCSSSAWATGTGIEVMIRGNGAVSIASFNGTAVTQRASGSGTFAATDTMRVEAQGNVYRVKNVTRGTTLATWTDSGNVVPRSGRYAGMTQSGNLPWFQSYYQSPNVTRWEFGDL